MDTASQVRKQSLTDTKILARAVGDSFRKLDPRTMVKNPVMFVVEVGALLTTVQLIWNAVHRAGEVSFDCRLRCGCGSRSSLPTSPKPWPKDEARLKRTRCANHERRQKQND